MGFPGPPLQRWHDPRGCVGDKHPGSLWQGARSLSLGMSVIPSPEPAWHPNTAPLLPSRHALYEEGAVGESVLGMPSEGKGCTFLQGLSSLSLSSCSPLLPPPQWAWGKRPLTLQPIAPESPHLWRAVMLRGHRTVNSKLSRLCHLLAGL